MVIEEKKTKSVNTTRGQHVFVIDLHPTDFESTSVKQMIEQVQQEVKSVMDGAIVDSSKLSLNFTV
jgi:hypothetical protein